MDIVSASGTVTSSPGKVTTLEGIESRLVRIEAVLKADAGSVVGFFKRNWAHMITWSGVAYSILKHL